MQKIVILLLLTYAIFAKEVAEVKSIEGKVVVKRDKKIVVLKLGSMLYELDLIITEKKSSLGVMFEDGTRIALGAKSIFSIKKFLVNPVKKKYDVDLRLIKGKASFSSGKVGELAPESVKFRIPAGIIGIRGTSFMVEVE
ncbi:MAG: FecR domain-containing protein [Sulfurovaceae bacterium]|nr:FecR domain-containing protein [Sulfurovaceae bacterium]